MHGDTLMRPFDSDTYETYVIVTPVVQEPKTAIINVAISQSEEFSTALIFCDIKSLNLYHYDSLG